MKTKHFYMALSFVFFMGIPNLVLATGSYMNSFNTLYKTTNTRLNSCKVCHTAVPTTNVYGKAFALKHKGAVTTVKALKLIQPLDSDKDTFTNIVEIRARTFPGARASKPPASPVLAAVAGAANGPQASDAVTEGSTFSSTGSTADFNLAPGYELALTGNDGDTNLVRKLTVMDATKVVDGVETRVVEESATENGALVKVSKRYMAISDSTNGLYSFGRDVTSYQDGQISGHDGSWLAGVDGHGPVMMPNPSEW
jgi:hypothetical protein